MFMKGYQGWLINHLLTLPIEAFFKKRDQCQVLWGVCEMQITITTYICNVRSTWQKGWLLTPGLDTVKVFI